MFDIGFWEVILISIVGLIVLGPERLPRVAATVGQWVGRARGYVRQISAELEREARQQDIKKQFDEAQSILNEGKQATEAFVQEVTQQVDEGPAPSPSEKKSVESNAPEAK